MLTFLDNKTSQQGAERRFVINSPYAHWTFNRFQLSFFGELPRWIIPKTQARHFTILLFFSISKQMLFVCLTSLTTDKPPSSLFGKGVLVFYRQTDILSSVVHMLLWFTVKKKNCNTKVCFSARCCDHIMISSDLDMIKVHVKRWNNLDVIVNLKWWPWIHSWIGYLLYILSIQYLCPRGGAHLCTLMV